MSQRLQEREAWQRQALSAITANVQHRLNNPLAALLAEAQLLGMDPELRGEQKESVDRLIELTRRIIVLVRGLEEEVNGSER
jgi:signal transduction histidine kinase